MSEDEGTDTSAQGVPSAEESDDGETADVDPAASTDGESEPTPESDDSRSAAANADAETTTDAEDAPETSEDIQQVLDRVTEYDDELARKVGSIVEEARDLNGTVTDQRAELEDLTERVEEQASTIEQLQTELEAREQRLEEYEEEVEDLESRLKRKQADFQNYKKRAKKRQQQMKDRATEDLVERLIGVRDNLKRALEEDSDDVDTLRDGVEMTLREFDRILEDENVTEIDPEPGTETDPQRHEVMMQVDSDQPEGTVADVYTPGYEMGDKVIQNAQVTVSNGELAETDGDGSAESAGQGDDATGDGADGADAEDDAIELGGEVDDREDAPADEADE
ncbi:nucleotide exchange factor GrpE [Natrinema amylolyticum]|uniref:nucleotide exchange factor GrpE n=1 Tax=Natrinema amylolyticum TaxID=2878679 RepID=UPI001CFAE576|nr:nucleotide exchange factor GrpE [Natrinema amylolyticum]